MHTVTQMLTFNSEHASPPTIDDIHHTSDKQTNKNIYIYITSASDVGKEGFIVIIIFLNLNKRNRSSKAKKKQNNNNHQ